MQYILHKFLVVVLLFVTGCASVGRIKKLETAVARITIGGDGDSITTWILAVGLILLVLTIPAGGAFYQHVLRPRRKRREKRDN